MVITKALKELIDEFVTRWTQRNFEDIGEVEALLKEMITEVENVPELVDLEHNG